MKSFFQWVGKNAALSFFLGVELFCLLFASALTVSTYLKDPEQPQLAINQTLILTEVAQEDLVQAELEQFTQSRKLNYKVVSTSFQEAIAEFTTHEDAILILSRRLEEQEIAGLKIHPDRLPLEQQLIDQSATIGGTGYYFIQDNYHTTEENQLTAFFKNDEAQNLVFQKFRKKSSGLSIKHS